MHHHVLLVCIERSSVRDTHIAKRCKTNKISRSFGWRHTFKPASGPTLVLPPLVLHAVVEKILTAPTICYVRVGSNADFLSGLRCWIQFTRLWLLHAFGTSHANLSKAQMRVSEHQIKCSFALDHSQLWTKMGSLQRNAKKRIEATYRISILEMHDYKLNLQL